MGTALNRDDIIEGLRELIAELHTLKECAGIRLVGGAALSLRYFERDTTQDLDALNVQPGSNAAVSAAATRIALRRGWNPDWINFEVEKVGAIPQWGRPVEWETIYDNDGIVIQLASKESLLAMKLRANRPGRDTRDIRLLLGLCEMSTLAEVELLYEEFYPGDSLTDRALAIVTAIFADGVPAPSPSPGEIELTPR